MSSLPGDLEHEVERRAVQVDPVVGSGLSQAGNNRLVGSDARVIEHLASGSMDSSIWRTAGIRLIPPTSSTRSDTAGEFLEGLLTNL